jgi:muramoyltetrapeptide carboxypeptidase
MKDLGFSSCKVFNSGEDFFDKWAGSPEDRLSLFYDAWNSDKNCIFATRGGSGVSHFVGKIDSQKLMHKKLLVGYSDLTLLLNYLSKELNTITLHGPTAMADFDEESLYYLRKALAMEDYVIDFKNCDTFNEPEGGVVSGKVIGGNLTRLSEFLFYSELDFRDKVVFLEEIGLSEHKIFNLLISLRDYKFFKPSAIIFGNLSIEKRGLMEKMISGIFGSVPIVFGLPFGHTSPNITIPIGADCVVNFKEFKVEFSFPDSEKHYAVDFKSSK